MTERWIVDWQRSDPDWLPYYTRANAGETLPDPVSPLGWTFVFEGGLVPGLVRGFEDMGLYAPGDLDADQPALLGVFGGYFYLSLSHMRLLGLRMGIPVEVFDRAFLGSHPDIPPYAPHPRDADPERLEAMGRSVAAMLGRSSWPEIEAELERLTERRRNRPALAELSDVDLLAHARSFQPDLASSWFWNGWATVSATLGPGMLGALCAGLGRPDLTLDLIAGIGELPSLSPSWRLWEIARQVEAGVPAAPLVSRFLTDFGARGPNEWDLHSMSWDADPAPVLAMIERLRLVTATDSPAERQQRQNVRREAATATIRDLARGDDGALATLETGLRSTAVCVPAREMAKALAVTAINEARMAFLELGARGVAAGIFAEPGDLMMLLDGELDEYVRLPQAFVDVIADRLTQYRTLFDIDPPFILADPPALADWPRRAPASYDTIAVGTVIQGVGGSAGVFTGRTRVVLDPAAPEALQPGEVLVAPFTDAAWTPLFLVAGAVVVDVGAINSHAVVVARELGIPCVVSTTDGTGRLRDGTEVLVDGAAGTITVLR